MKIYKTYRVEGAHIVRNCTSDRCSHSIHGHSAKIEICLEGSELDNAQMLMDFGLMKKTIGEFIDIFDHTYILCSKDSEEFKDVIKKHSDRVLEVDFNPSAEMLSLFILTQVNSILKQTKFNNGESRNIICSKVIYHETETGRAECSFYDDVVMLEDYKEVLENIKVSPALEKNLSNIINSYVNPVIEQQITL